MLSQGLKDRSALARKKEKRRKRRVSLAEGREKAKMGTSLVSFCVVVGQMVESSGRQVREVSEWVSESRSLVSNSLGPPWTIESMEFSRPEYWSG